MVLVILTLIRNRLDCGAKSVVQSSAASVTSLSPQEGDQLLLCVELLLLGTIVPPQSGTLVQRVTIRSHVVLISLLWLLMTSTEYDL